MRSTIVGGIAAAVLTIALAGCAGAGSAPDAPASPGASDTPTAPASPIVTGADARARLADLPMPSAGESVLAIGTVLEREGIAMLCVGPVAESAPPQCAGPELVGWDWAVFDHEETGGVRWAQGVAVEGTYDAQAQTFTQQGEPMSAAAIQLPAIEIPTGTLDDATAQAVVEDLFSLERPDLFSANPESGIVALDVAYDDGSMQAAIDEVYGPGVVFVVSAMR